MGGTATAGICAGTSTERAVELRYSVSIGMEKMMEQSPAAMTGSMVLHS